MYHTLVRIVDNNGGFTIIPEMPLAFLSEGQRKNVRKIEGDYLSQIRISLSQMMNEGIWKYGIRL